MIYREQRLTQVVKQYDPQLFVIRGSDTKMYLHRWCTRWDRYDIDGCSVSVSRKEPLMVMALTDDWTAHGNAVDVGVELLLDRIKSIDSHRDDGFIDEAIMSHAHKKEYHEEKFSKDIQDFARYELRGAIKKDFAYANTSGLDTSSVEKKHERKLKQWQS